MATYINVLKINRINGRLDVSLLPIHFSCNWFFIGADLFVYRFRKFTCLDCLDIPEFGLTGINIDEHIAIHFLKFCFEEGSRNFFELKIGKKGFYIELFFKRFSVGQIQ